MEREIGRWNRATGIVRGNVELWIGDTIKCRVYTMDRQGGYIHVTGDVLWDTDYGQYCIAGEYDTGGKQYRNTFALHKVVREPVTFLKKADRSLGSQRDIIFDMVSKLKAHYKEPMELNDIKAEIEDVDDSAREQAIIDTVTEKLMVEMVSYITDMGIVPHTEIYEAFNK